MPGAKIDIVVSPAASGAGDRARANLSRHSNTTQEESPLFALEVNRDVVVIKLSPVSAESVEVSAIRTALSELSFKGKTLIVDCQGVKSATDTAAVVLALKKDLSQGELVHLAGLDPKVQTNLERMRLGQFFSSHESVDAAMQALFPGNATALAELPTLSTVSVVWPKRAERVTSPIPYEGELAKISQLKIDEKTFNLVSVVQPVFEEDTAEDSSTEQLHRLTANLISTDSDPVAIDLSGVYFLASTTLATLVSLHELNREKFNCPLVILGATGRVREMLAITKLDKLLSVVDAA